MSIRFSLFGITYSVEHQLRYEAYLSFDVTDDYFLIGRFYSFRAAQKALLSEGVQVAKLNSGEDVFGIVRDIGKMKDYGPMLFQELVEEYRVISVSGNL